MVWSEDEPQGLLRLVCIRLMKENTSVVKTQLDTMQDQSNKKSGIFIIVTIVTLIIALIVGVTMTIVVIVIISALFIDVLVFVVGFTSFILGFITVIIRHRANLTN